MLTDDDFRVPANLIQPRTKFFGIGDGGTE